MNPFSQTLEAITPSLGPSAADFNQAKTRGQIKRVVAVLMGRSNRLLDVKTILEGVTIHTCRYRGAHTVRIDQIKGSEGRYADFDQDFNPLKSHNRDRWLNIARAWLAGVYLPAVELIKIKDTYIVRDGHHRISVAHYMGSDFIDARVTEWVLAD
jgi:hypothetical protein